MIKSIYKCFNKEFSSVKNNIIIVSACQKNTKTLAKVLADKLNLLFADVEEILQYNIEDEFEIINKCGLDYLNKLKRKAILDIAGYENTFIYISLKLFVNDKNFDKFKKRGHIIFLKPTKKLLQNLYSEDTSLTKNERKIDIDAYLIRAKLCEKYANNVVKFSQFNEKEIFDSLENIILSEIKLK